MRSCGESGWREAKDAFIDFPSLFRSSQRPHKRVLGEAPANFALMKALNSVNF